MLQATPLPTGLPTVKALLADARLPWVERRALLSYVTGLSYVALVTRDHEVPSANQCVAFQTLVERRLHGEPLAYLVGEREFFSRVFKVDGEVLIPRPETELLVELALSQLSVNETAHVLDLGTGSGNIGITIACERPQARVTVTDVAPGALSIAQHNAQRLGTRITALLSDWYAALDQLRFDVIVSNPPYIRQDDVHLEEGDLRFEPRVALCDGRDGLFALNQVITESPRHLVSGGWLFVEHGYQQAASVRTLFQRAGLADIQTWRDLAGIERVSGGCWRRESPAGSGRPAPTLPSSLD